MQINAHTSRPVESGGKWRDDPDEMSAAGIPAREMTGTRFIHATASCGVSSRSTVRIPSMIAPPHRQSAPLSGAPLPGDCGAPPSEWSSPCEQQHLSASGELFGASAASPMQEHGQTSTMKITRYATEQRKAFPSPNDPNQYMNPILSPSARRVNNDPSAAQQLAYYQTKLAYIEGSRELSARR